MDWKIAQRPYVMPDEVAQGVVLEDDLLARALAWCGPLRGRRAIALGANAAELGGLLLGEGAAGVEHIDLQAADGEPCLAGARPGRLAADAAGRAAHGLARLDAASFDLALGCGAFAESTSSGVADVLATLRRVLVPGAPVVLVEPHPAALFLSAVRAAPLLLDCGRRGWFGSRDRMVVGRQWFPEGGSAPLRYVQKSLEDWFVALRDAGYRELPELTEFGVDDELAARHPEHFGPLRDRPLYLGLRLRTPERAPVRRVV